jgi:hypothetical protein
MDPVQSLLARLLPANSPTTTSESFPAAKSMLQMHVSRDYRRSGCYNSGLGRLDMRAGGVSQHLASKSKGMQQVLKRTRARQRTSASDRTRPPMLAGIKLPRDT